MRGRYWFAGVAMALGCGGDGGTTQLPPAGNAPPPVTTLVPTTIAIVAGDKQSGAAGVTFRIPVRLNAGEQPLPN